MCKKKTTGSGKSFAFNYEKECFRVVWGGDFLCLCTSLKILFGNSFRTNQFGKILTNEKEIINRGKGTQVYPYSRDEKIIFCGSV